MEERPSDRAHEKHYHHGGERSPSRAKTSLKNDPSQCQHQETQTKKTGDGKINGSTTEREKTVGTAYPANGNGHRSQLDSNWKLKQSGKAHPTHSKVGIKGSHGYRIGMDSRNDRAPDLRAHEGKKEPVALPNGVVPLSSGFFTNGYPGKPAPDNDGSGSESGYATPKKRKPLRGTGKGVEPVIQPALETAASPKPEAHAPVPEQMEKPAAAKAETRPKQALVPAVTALPACEPQHKNSDGKAAAAGPFSKKHEDRPGKAKPNAKEKEDSWTLFKPPPVFPVDNSSAKIVPKISYASKVKENLNKAAQAGGEAVASLGPPQLPAPGRPSQVPMSAMKTITSSSFANGPLTGEGNGCPLSRPLFALASTVPPENVVLAADESASTNQKALGDIFQNQWGLSFINDPSAGPDGAGSGGVAPARRTPGKGKAAEVTFQGDSPVAPAPQAGGPEAVPPAKAYELEKRTSPQTPNSSVLKAGLPLALAPTATQVGQTLPSGPDGQKDAEAQSLGAIAFTSPKDPAVVEPRGAMPANGISSPRPRGSGLPKAQDHGCSWGSFDVKAAVNYHTNEMEYILNLQKQDPKRVVVYGETKDGPDQ
ncbi:hypothetical protein AAFF_G00213700 [Aldrovandia affinis]|uniref:Nuclear fragile X mental retardation-interacting protein 2 n=1 Tax=Aldrovandia affinis TaxID=143900 RepID=A0AAD7W4X6_9TELE|nr:hypothetical protein AAFF_G00213700 [Aldrovandia affinis]